MPYFLLYILIGILSLIAGDASAQDKEPVKKGGVRADSQASEKEKLLPKASESGTKFKGLIILIDFPDKPANIDLVRVENVINGSGYKDASVSSSLKDYWLAQSRGHVVLTNDVRGYFRAPQPASWYKEQPWTEFLSLAKLALNWVVENNKNYDWNSLSRSRDPGELGTLLSVNFLTTEWICGSGATHLLNDWAAPNGRKTGQITSSMLKSPWDRDINLFWLTHEQGHSIWGVPDTYDNDGSSGGTGLYSVMGGNGLSGQVESFGGPFIAQKRWVKVITVFSDREYTLTQDGDTVARYGNRKRPKEYFIIEARMKSTLGNGMLGAERGLLIWHVDEDVRTVNTKEDRTFASHYAYSIVQADGLFDLERKANEGDAGDLFSQGKSLSDSEPDQHPNSRWWDGSKSEFHISNIRFLSDHKISFSTKRSDPSTEKIK